MVAGRLTVGRYLQKQREEKNIPLESVARITRITLVNLQALEREEFHRLPAEIFCRGYLRSYAKFLKLNPEEVVAAYQTQKEEQRNKIMAQESAPPTPTPFLKNILNLFLDFLSAILGATPPFSIGKAILPPKD